jgi:hypothetical protein
MIGSEKIWEPNYNITNKYKLEETSNWERRKNN